jgi:hypothetical protein
MAPRPFRIASVNVQRGNERSHALLHSTDVDFLLLQEPWYGTIGTSHSDVTAEGSAAKGFACHEPRKVLVKRSRDLKVT